ncbi:hypothetical protein Droror1_Dr00004994 [Drosera rotundifolia]
MGKEPGSGQGLSLADRLLRDAQCSEYCQFDLEMYGTGNVNPPSCAGRMPLASELPPLGTSEAAPYIDTNLQYLHLFAKGLSSMSDAVLNRNLFARFSHMQKIPLAVFDKCELQIMPSGLTFKQFLVFDQTGDKTTLIYSLGKDTPVHCPASSIPKPANCFHLNLNDVQMTGDANYDSDPILTTEDSRCSDSCGRNEYTDEIDALLSSEDEDNYSYNDEETSTGHSPSPMAGQNEKELCEEGMEEVASSPLPSKRLKVSHASYATLPSSGYASIKALKSSDYEGDAGSSNAGEDATKSGDMTCLSGKKRERICETINILRSIIPGGGKGSNPAMVLDEAIQYLKNLKLEAKSLGLLEI